MGIFNFKKNKDRNNDRAWSSLTDAFFSFSNRWKSVPERNKKEMLKLNHRNPWLNLAVDIRANSVARAEFYIEEQLKNGETKEITDDPVLDLLNDPNPLMEGFNLKYIIQAWRDLVGECLILLDRDGAGNIIGLYPVSAESIHQMPSTQSPYWQLIAGTEIIQVYVTEAIYIKSIDVQNIYGRGQGKAQAISDELTIHELSGKQIGQYFYNNAVPPYLIGLEGAGAEQAKRVRDDWLNKNQGWVKRYLPHFLSGKVNAVKLQAEFKDMELNELRHSEKDAIMQFFQVPPELYGKTENSNRSTSYIAETNFAKQVTEPALDFIMIYLNNYLMPEFQTSKNIKRVLKYRSVVPRDKEFERDTKFRIPWAFTVNEHRRVAGERDIEGFDEVYPIPLNIQLTKFEDLTTKQQDAIKSVKKAISKQEDVRLDQLTQIIDSVAYEELNEEVVDEYVNLLIKTGTGVLIDLNVLDSGSVWEITNPFVTEQMQNRAGDRIKLIDSTLKKNLRNEIIESFNEGESIPKLMKRLNDQVFEGYKKGYEVERIARTETMTTVNYSTQLAYEDAGVEQKKWLATKDDRTRDNHLIMDGQTVGIKEEFESPDGFRALTPGDFGIADEDINCRCTIRAVYSNKSMMTDTKFWKMQDKTARDAEKEFKRVYAKRFQKIQLEINDKLKELS